MRSVGGEGFGHLQETDGWRMIRRIWTLLKHWREAKSALSTLSYLYDGKSRALDALGGLTEEEIAFIDSMIRPME